MSRSTTPGDTMYVSEYNDAVRTERCYFCPARHGLQTHHIVPQRKNGSDLRENLVIVCETCHDKLESLYDQRFYERLGLSDNKGKRRSHFACLISDCTSQATLKVKNEYGNEAWFCETHSERPLDAHDAEILREVK